MRHAADCFCNCAYNFKPNPSGERTYNIWQKERLIRRDSCTPEAAQARIDAQMPLEAKRRHCQLVVDNSGSPEETQAQVDFEVLKLLLDFDCEGSWSAGAAVGHHSAARRPPSRLTAWSTNGGACGAHGSLWTPALMKFSVSLALYLIYIRHSTCLCVWIWQS